MPTQIQARALFDPSHKRRAIIGSFLKLDPRHQVKNPVMFVVEVGSVLTTLLFLQALVGSGEAPAGSILAISLWLWFTVVFANFAEAMAEGRGKAQADTLRRARRDVMAKKLARPQRDAPLTTVSVATLRQGDVVLVEAGAFIPSDGEVIEGIASVDESAITGESAPVIRESGGDRSAVTGGTRVLSDWLVVRITADPGETFLDRMIAMVEGARRQKTPNEIALNILLAAMTIIFLLATVTLLPFSRYSVNAARHVHEVFESQVSLLRPDATGHLRQWDAGADGPSQGLASRVLFTLDTKEYAVAQWVYEHRQMAGLGTATLPSAEALYVPRLGMRGAVRVLGVRPAAPRRLLAPEQIRLLETFANQAAPGFERAALAGEAQQAQVQIATERLRNALLSAVSHDLRAPLTAIARAASGLLDDTAPRDPSTRHELCQTIADEAHRLNRLVNNVLEMTRLE